MIRTVMISAALAAMLFASPSMSAAASVIGERTLHLVDAARPDPLAAGHPREWMVTLLYPASAPARAATEAYIPDPAVLAQLKADAANPAAAAALDTIARRKTDLVPDAAPKAGRHSLLLLSPGFGELGRNYVYLASAFVRRGFAVAIIEHPYLGLVRLPDGRLLRASDDPAAASDDPAAMQPEIRGWTRDLSVVLDRLFQTETAGRGVGLDPARIAASGHSMGGTVALDGCGGDLRIKACIDFDGTPQGSLSQDRGPGGPTLIVLGSPVYSDADLEKLGRTRQAQDARRQGVVGAVRAVLAKGVGGPAWTAEVRGGAHMSYSDAPEVSPDQLTRFGGTYMSAQRSRDVYVGLTEAFVRAYFPGGGGGAALEQFATRTPEVALTEIARPGH